MLTYYECYTECWWGENTSSPFFKSPKVPRTGQARSKDKQSKRPEERIHTGLAKWLWGVRIKLSGMGVEAPGLQQVDQ